jgi:class 3 adenylate cyclase
VEKLMSIVDEDFLDERLGKIEHVAPWSPRTLSKFENFIRSADDYQLFKVDPHEYAREKGLKEKEACDLFLHATRLGIFDIQWGLVCPMCGDTVESFATLRKLDSHFHCTICSAVTTAALDDYIMISYMVSPRVRHIAYHHPATLNIVDYWQKYRFNRQWRQKRGGAPIADLFIAATKAVLGVAAEGRSEIELAVTPGYLKIFNMVEERVFTVLVREQAEPGTQELALVYAGTEVSAAPESVAVGALRLHVENRNTSPTALAIANIDADTLDGGVDIAPFYTAKQLLNSQTFRNLFSSEVILEAEGIGIRDITLLFTDLKGSTAMYDRIGDLQAFSLVRQHFESLTGVVVQNNGAIVKTIGDAVMASFTSPLDGLHAALQMLKEIEAFNASRGSPDLVLKVGLHHGAAIAVTLNDRLDFFGQTVNIAARVQGLADEDEIYITDDVYQYPGVTDVLASFKVVAEQSQLKGIAESVSVHRIHVQPGVVARN